MEGGLFHLGNSVVLRFNNSFFMCTDEPFPPGQPQAKEQDRDHITIKWEPPENDGGAPITGYDIERKEPKGNRWIKVS